MPSSFLARTIDVEVDQTTWPTSRAPANLLLGIGRCSVDVGEALHMLGSVTMPNSLSPASPALFWAWLRYFLAPTDSRDLRITMDFSDLDPHQKGILSDDFGVAIATQWLIDRFGGFQQIVDGRRFILHFSRFLRRKHTSKAKVGPSKTPDFVILDLSGKWHILECKGTQTKSHQVNSLNVAITQKRALQIRGSIRGESLASALYIAHERESLRTHLKIIDPNEAPLIELTDHQSEEMEIKARRVAVARAMGIIGLNEVAVELSLPADIDPDSELLRPSEASRVRSSRDARFARASEQARERDLVNLTYGSREYEGREVTLEIPPGATQLPFRKVTIRQGVSLDLIEELSAPGSLAENVIDRRIEPFAAKTGITTSTDGNHISLRYGDIMFSEMIWNK